jgi:hypothetical protein
VAVWVHFIHVVYPQTLNLAAIALLLVTEFHLEPVRFLLSLSSAVLLLSMFILWPLSYTMQSLRKRGADFAALTGMKRQKARAPRGVAFLAGISITVTAILYVVYSLNPGTELSWFGGTPITRSFIGLSIASAVLALSLIFFTIQVWRDKLWSMIWRTHYTLVTLAGLFAACSLLRLLF